MRVRERLPKSDLPTIPNELWQEVINRLDLADLFAVFSVSLSMNENVNTVWTDFVNRRKLPSHWNWVSRGKSKDFPTNFGVTPFAKAQEEYMLSKIYMRWTTSTQAFEKNLIGIWEGDRTCIDWANRFGNVHSIKSFRTLELTNDFTFRMRDKAEHHKYLIRDDYEIPTETIRNCFMTGRWAFAYTKKEPFSTTSEKNYKMAGYRERGKYPTIFLFPRYPINGSGSPIMYFISIQSLDELFIAPFGVGAPLGSLHRIRSTSAF